MTPDLAYDRRMQWLVAQALDWALTSDIELRLWKQQVLGACLEAVIPEEVRVTLQARVIEGLVDGTVEAYMNPLDWLLVGMPTVYIGPQRRYYVRVAPCAAVAEGDVEVVMSSEGDPCTGV